MTATVLLCALTLAQAQPQKPATDVEKKEFLKLVAKLPSRGEFYTDDAITTAIPYTRVLLALTEKDFDKKGIYPFLALSRGLIDRKESSQYGILHFGSIAHPTIKLFWASVLFDEGRSSPEMLTFLYKALKSKDDAEILARMSGSSFEDFRQRVIRTYEISRQTKVELVKQHAGKAPPDFTYTKDNCVLGPGQLLYAIREVQQRGELITSDLSTGQTKHREIPQLAGFKAELVIGSHFAKPALSVNAHGDVLCGWNIGFNGGQALALLKKGSDSWLVKRIDFYLANCCIVADPAGAWYLIHGAPTVTIYHVDKELNLTRLGIFAGNGHHSDSILHARFISENVLHFVWGDVLPKGNHLRMRCIDFDVKKQKWLHNREIFRLDKFVSSANEPTVLQLPDDSLHYIWRVDEGAMPGEATGLYYQAETDGKTIKIGGAHDYRAIVAGSRIVVCYTQKDSPAEVSFRVINHGVAGPASEIIANKGGEYPLASENLLLHAEGERLWFLNTRATNIRYELKLADTK
jgi:hypothetical protein